MRQATVGPMLPAGDAAASQRHEGIDEMLRFNLGAAAISVTVLLVATGLLVASALGDPDAQGGGQYRLLIGATAGIALLVLANFAIVDDDLAE
jgi:hypothetical protein